ncbi:MAG: response regulator, partial [Sphingobacteriaceae bacterium]
LLTNLIKDTASEEQKQYLNVLEFSATNLLSVVNDILDYNKIELDKIELEALPVNLPGLLQKISNGLAMKAAEKGLEWKLEIDEILEERTIITDPTRLTQIIYNLGGNAIKFTNDGAVNIKVKFIEQNDKKINIEFSISDTGIGIDMDRQEAIFERFTQASSDTTRKYGGTGLGLAIVKRLLKLFGSTIQLESIPEQGSVFKFAIEFTLYNGRLEHVSGFTPVKTSLNGMKLLIAEDNSINVLLLEKLLAKWDVQTTIAANGREAVSKILNDDFDCVLMDIHMPEMDGFEATRAIRVLSDPLKAQIHIIAVTASVSHNVYDRIMAAGMHDFLPKPFQADHLYDKLQQVHKSRTLDTAIPVKAAG